MRLSQRHFTHRRGVGGHHLSGQGGAKKAAITDYSHSSTSTSTSTSTAVAPGRRGSRADHRIGRASREVEITTFAEREAKKRSLLQLLRLLTRSMVSREAIRPHSTTLGRRPFSRKSRAFLEWAKRVATVKIHKRRGSFAALGLYSRRARLAFAGLASRRAYMHQIEGPSLRRATFHRDTRAQRRAFAHLRARAGAPRARSRGLRVRSVMFLKLWHCAKAMYNWNLHVHKRRDRRLRWACAASPWIRRCWRRASGSGQPTLPTARPVLVLVLVR